MSSLTASTPSLISFVPWSTSTSTTALSPAPSITTPTPPTTTDAFPTSQVFPPMTTQWSKPDSCTWTYDAGQELSSGMAGPIAWLDLMPKAGDTTLSCYPPGMFTEGRTGVFSPATCPSGWTTVSVHRNTDEPKEYATTTAVCCSSEYTLNGNHCYREIPTVLAVPIQYNTSESTYNLLNGETSVLVSATLAVHTIRALFQEEDKEVLGLTYEEEIRAEPEDSGLTMSERVGIGVGSAIGGLLLIGVAVFLYIRRRAKKQKGYPPHEIEAVDGPVVALGSGPTMVVAQHPSQAYSGGGTTLAGSMTEDDDGKNDDVYDGEIEVLRAQKAAIQRRIEELECVESPTNPTPDEYRRKD